MKTTTAIPLNDELTLRLLAEKGCPTAEMANGLAGLPDYLVALVGCGDRHAILYYPPAKEVGSSHYYTMLQANLLLMRQAHAALEQQIASIDAYARKLAEELNGQQPPGPGAVRPPTPADPPRQ